MSSAINDRRDAYGKSLTGRAKFLLDVIDVIRKRVGRKFFLSVKLSVIENDNATLPWPIYYFFKKGNTLKESIQIAKWAEEHGADAIHVSTGSMFPHPHNPAGPFPLEIAWKTYQSVIASGKRPTYLKLFQRTFLNYLALRYRRLHWVFRRTWGRTQHFLDKHGEAIPNLVEGMNVPAAVAIKQQVKIPVICTGGFQTAEGILRALGRGCDAVSIARPLLANPQLPIWLKEGWPGPKDPPCSYCNRCLLNVLEHPLGCYDERRFSQYGDKSYEEMIRRVMAIFPDKTDSGWL
jgi:2,4-dienoyl-CoA reductase (NADPH2)